MARLSIADSRAYASRIVDRLTDEGVFGDNETLRHNNVRIVAEELLEIFGKQSDDD